jgi:Fe-S cluster biogenesis protein NfuA
MDDLQARECVARIEALLEELEHSDAAMELVQALLDLYGEGLGRIVAHDPGLMSALAGDEVVSHLLLLHGLHPVPLEERVVGALEELRPYMDSHGGGVELLGVEDSVVRLRLEGTCNGCPSSTATLKGAIEDAIHKAAPEVEDVVAEGVAEPGPALLQIEIPCVRPAG